MRPPTKNDLLDEIRRLMAENERLKRLVKTQRPELDKLRDVEVAVRHLVQNVPRQLEHVHEKLDALMVGTDDLPTVAEVSGSWGTGRQRVYSELDKTTT